MNYTKVKIYLSEEAMDPLTTILEDNGITGTVVEDANVFRNFMNKKNEYDWDYVDTSVMELENVQTSVTFYLEDTLYGIDRLDRILHDIIALDIQRVEVGSVCDEDWKDNWKKYFKPTKITDRIVIKPTWEEYEKVNDNDLIIEIDPGMAFGTGTHATTSLCIKLLEKYLSFGQLKVLDIGCGSGILSIAAALLGAREVVGVEIDPIAVSVSRENVTINHLDSIIRIIEGDLTKGLDYIADIVVSNLMADLVIRLSRDVTIHLVEGGIFISSGILLEKQEQVASSIREAGFNILDILEDGDWCAIAARFEERR